MSGLSKQGDDYVDRSIQEGIAPKEILHHMLTRMREEQMSSEDSLSYAIYEYSMLNSPIFMEVLNARAKKKWNRLLEYGMEQGDFQTLDVEQITDTVFFYIRGCECGAGWYP